MSPIPQSRSFPKRTHRPRNPATTTERLHNLAKLSQDEITKYVKSVSGYVCKIARKYEHNGVDFEDLVSEGNVGVLQAIDRFDASRGFKFLTYASWWIEHFIKRAVQDQGRTIRVPVHAFEKLPKRPTEFSRMNVLVRKSRGGGVLSVDAPVSGEGTATLSDFIPDVKPTAEEDLLKKERESIFDRATNLTDRERAVLLARAAGERLKTIGDRYGLCRERVRQIEAIAVAKIRHFCP